MDIREKDIYLEAITRIEKDGALGDYRPDNRFLSELSDNIANDFYIITYGRDVRTETSPPIVRRKFYSLHYVLSGRGVVEYRGHRQIVGKGELFLLTIDDKISYRSAGKEPWEYIYFDFAGLCQRAVVNRMGFTDSLIMKADREGRIDKCVHELYNTVLESGSRSLKSIGMLYLLVDAIAECHEQQNKDVYLHKYVMQAVNYIGNHYVSISVKDVARHCGISIAYLDKIFLKTLDIRPQDFITLYRIKTAANMLEFSSTPLDEISEHIGYASSKYLIRMFKKIYGVTPEQYRREKQKRF